MSEVVRLNLGCGLTAPIGWMNADRSPNLALDRVPFAKELLRRSGLLQDAHMATWPRNIRWLNATKRLPFPDGTVDTIYSSHMLEHLYFDQANGLLRECSRILRPGGIIRLALPNGEEIARSLIANLGDPKYGLGFTQGLHMAPLKAPTVWERQLARFASAPHRWQPTSSLVISMLREAGFVEFQTRPYLESDIPDISAVEHRESSLFFEALGS